jgi:hypothetical protein
MMRSRLGFMVLCLALVTSSVAHAAPADATKSEAAERFDRGLRLVNDGDLSGGLGEFNRAYALIPSPTVLYNIGLVYAALHRPVESAKALDAALLERGSLKPESVERATTIAREQHELIGHVDVATNVKEGTVEVDNVVVAKLPLTAALNVASGPHTIGVISAGYAPSRREILVAGRERTEVSLDLVAIEGLLGHIAVHCKLPAADVFVDAERIGKTPLESTITVAPGKHEVEVRREGYSPVSREITLKDGAHAELTLNPGLDRGALLHGGGWVSIDSSEPQTVVTVDGEDVGLLTSALRLPVGPHRLHLESGGFVPAERDVDVTAGGTTTVKVAFEPTPETRSRYVSGASSRRTWSWITIGLGTAAAATGAVLAITAQSQLQAARTDLAAVNGDWARGAGGSCDHTRELNTAQLETCSTRLNEAQNSTLNLETRRALGWVVAGAGGAVLVTGVLLLVTGNDQHKYDEKPARETAVRWRVAPSVGLREGSLSFVGDF